MSLIMVACKRMIPIGMSYMNSLVQETIQVGKQKFLEVTFFKLYSLKFEGSNENEFFGSIELIS